MKKLLFISKKIIVANLNYKKWHHAGVNFIFLTTTLVINILFGIATIRVFDYITINDIGISTE